MNTITQLLFIHIKTENTKYFSNVPRSWTIRETEKLSQTRGKSRNMAWNPMCSPETENDIAEKTDEIWIKSGV